MRHRTTGILFVLSGMCFLAGVLDPPILPTWGGSAADVMATGSAHRARPSTWLITLSIAVGLAAVELLARTLDTDWPGRPVAVPSRQRVRPRLGNLRPGRDEHPARRAALARLVPGRPALGRRTQHRVLRSTGTGRDGLYRRGGPAHPSATQIDGIRLPGRDGPAAGPARRIPWRVPVSQFLAFIAVGIAALAHRAPTAATAGHRGHTGPGQALRTSPHRRRR